MMRSRKMYCCEFTTFKKLKKSLNIVNTWESESVKLFEIKIFEVELPSLNFLNNVFECG